MSYIDGVGIIVIGGTSSDAGRIEVFDGNEWKQITQGEADQWSTDLVQLPTEYKYFTATQEPNCMNQDWCKGIFFSTVTVGNFTILSYAVTKVLCCLVDLVANQVLKIVAMIKKASSVISINMALILITCNILIKWSIGK